jgi:DNA-binding transcriptional regulator LsrR (DeoR family)
VRISGIDEVRRWSSEELLLRAAWFYYKDELTQDEIAKPLCRARASERSGY